VAGAAGTEERETRATNGTTKSKSRSVSRGKGGSIFDRITGRKEEPATEGEPAAPAPATETTETTEAPKDGKSRESFRNACQCTPTYAYTAPAETAEAAAPVDAAAAAEEPKKEEVKAEESKKAEEPKTTRRGSRFGDFLKKIEGKPTVLEKKSAGSKDVAPPVPPKDTEAPKTEDKTEEEAATAAVAAAPLPVVATEEAKEEEAKETAPAAKHEKKNFLERFLPKEPKPKAPATAPVAKEVEPAKAEETPATEAPATTEATTEATPAAETTETPAVNGEAKETPAADQKEKRRSSFFPAEIAASLKKIGQRAEKAVEPKKEVKAETNGNHVKTEEPVADKPADDKPAETPAVVTTPAPAAAPTSKKEKEHQENPLSKLGRRLSTAFRNTGKDHSKKETPAAKAPETTEPTEAKAETEEPAKEEETKPAEESKPAETEKPVNSIGDVVPDAVNVGSAPPATATVSATA